MDPPSPPRLLSPRQLPPSLPDRLPDPRLHQLRQRRRPQRHPLRQQRRPSPLLHHLHRRPAPPPNPRRTPAAAPLVARAVRRPHQRFDAVLPGRGVLLLVLAVVCSCWGRYGAGGFQLGCGCACDCGDFGVCLLLGWWEGQVCCAGQSGQDGVITLYTISTVWILGMMKENFVAESSMILLPR